MNEREELAMLQRRELEELRALEAQESLKALPGANNPFVRQGAQLGSGAIEGLASLPGLPMDLARSMNEGVYRRAQTEPTLNPMNPLGYVVDKGAQLGARGLVAGTDAITRLMPRDVNQALDRTTQFGSGAIQDALQKFGVTMPTPTDATGSVLRRAGQDVGASALPAGLMLKAARTAPAITSAPSLLRQGIGAARADPGKFMAADFGSALASGTGAGLAREAAPGNPLAEFAGQMGGALTPGILAAGARGAVRWNPEVMRQNVEDFARAGTTPSVGEATGRPGLLAFEQTLAKTPGGYGVSRGSAQGQAEDIGQSVDDIVSGLTKKPSVEQAGRTIERGIKSFVTNHFRPKSESLYNIVDSFIPPHSSVAVTNTQRTLQQLTDEIPGAPRLSGLLTNPKLTQIQKALDFDVGKSNTLPYTAVKQLRSKVGRMLSNPELVSDLPRAELKKLYGSLSDDMGAAAKASGPLAFNAFTRANNYYRSGMERIDGTLERIASKANPEDVFRAATGGAKEGASTLRAIRKSVEPDDWDVVAGTVLKRLGRAKPRYQDDLGEKFSVDTFLTNWNSMSREAKSSLFGGTRYGRMQADLDSIAKTASAIRDKYAVVSNTSGTGRALANIGAMTTAGSTFLTGMLTGDAVLAVGGPATVAALAGLSAGSAKLMTSPKFVNFLASTTKVPMHRLPSYVARLTQNMQFEDDETKAALSEYLNRLRVK